VEDIGPDPIPDSYYGLLGTLPCQEPQSHICSLPSEVLRHIFAFLPVDDLYWNVSLVCHLWREIISDPLFIPWKKLYHRYLMNEEQAVSKVDGILLNYGIEKESDLCVLNLIRYTATTKCSPSVDPGRALWSLRDHLLLPEAEACVRQHLPDLYVAAAVSEEAVGDCRQRRHPFFSRESVVVIKSLRCIFKIPPPLFFFKRGSWGVRRERERILSRLHVQCRAECRAWARSHNPEVMTGAKIKESDT